MINHNDRIDRDEMLASELRARVPKMRTLVFSNADATPKNVRVECGLDCVGDIMEWYGGYFARDHYTVTLDGRDVPIDQYGSAKGEIK